MPFVSVTPASQTPREGELARYDVDGRPVAVAKVGGELYAFDDTCSHKQCSLSEGELENTQVICPCHNGAFDVTTGEVTAPPPTEPVSTYPARLEGDQLQIEL